MKFLKFFHYMRAAVRHNQREDKFLRATNYKHYDKETTTAHNAPKTSRKSRKAIKATSASFAVVIALAAFIVPTTTLAPGVEAYADSRVASYSVGDIDKFASVITDNCVEVTTVPETEAATVETTTVAETTVEETTAPAEKKKSDESEKNTKEEKSEAVKSNDDDNDDDNNTDDNSKSESSSSDKSSDNSSSSDSGSGSVYSGSTLVDIGNPDYGYSPSHVSLSSYDRAKLERLVMGEAGTMGYTGCALVAQSIRDAMNRSGTSSIDQIISEYQYFGSTAIEPNSDVLSAVSYIFDQDGSAVQHRVLCFYIGYSSWHETQTFITSLGGVRFFDLNV